MAVYIESLEKPKACGDCPCVEQNIGLSHCIQRCRLSRKEISDSEYHVKAPDWCPMKEYAGRQGKFSERVIRYDRKIIEATKEEYELRFKCASEIIKELEQAAINGKSKRQQEQEWNTQRFYNMDSALTRIEELAHQMQEDAKKISDIVNEGFTVKQVRQRYGGYGDKSRTEDA